MSAVDDIYNFGFKAPVFTIHIFIKHDIAKNPLNCISCMNNRKL